MDSSTCMRLPIGCADSRGIAENSMLIKGYLEVSKRVVGGRARVTGGSQMFSTVLAK